MVKRYIKKVPVVEAVRWTGYNFDEIRDFVGFNNAYFQRTNPPEVYIPTPEGAEYASIGDYIIKLADGEIRTCDANLFKSTYEEVEE